jgi:hypothetical protein
MVRLVRTEGLWYVVDEKHKRVTPESFRTWHDAKPVQLLKRLSKPKATTVKRKSR